MKRLISSLAVFMLCFTGGVAAEDKPVSLHIDAPNSNGGLPLLSESGWPISIKMVINYEDFLGYAIDKNYTNKGRAGFIVIDDPDGCPWMDDADWRGAPLPPPGCEPFLNEFFEVVAESDETYIEFRPDVDDAGLPDGSGDGDELLELVDSAGSDGPEFQKEDSDICVPGTDDSDCVQMGPYTGGEEVDGYGIGSDDDIVGLFIYTEVGIGLSYKEPAFEQQDDMTVRNLAGLVNSVTYDLSDLSKTYVPKAKGQKGKPEEIISEEARIWAHINMPQQVVRNIVQWDYCTGVITYDEPPLDDQVVECSEGTAWSIDGGPVSTPPEVFDRPRAAAIYLLENTTFEVKAFLVSGHAPDELSDANGDGDYRDDAELAGYTVLSNLDSIALLQISDLLCWGGGGNSMYKDLDGNGEYIGPIVCGPGPGGIAKPPR